VIRTQIQLTVEQYERLRKIGAAEDKGLAEQVREAVALYLAKRPGRHPPLDELGGGFRPLAPEEAGDLAPHDRQWAEAILRSKRK